MRTTHGATTYAGATMVSSRRIKRYRGRARAMLGRGPGRAKTMFKSILAISEGGPDAAMSYSLAALVASMFKGTVDAVHFSETQPGDSDIATQSMPFLKSLSDGRLKARRRESERVFHQLIEPIRGSSFQSGPD